MSVNSLWIRCACLEGTTAYWAKPPSVSDPKYRADANASPGRRNTGSTKTRCPIRLASTLAPIATISPHASAPWMRGNRGTLPTHPTSARSEIMAGAPVAVVGAMTSLAYQPVRVLMSVLLTPADRMRRSTSPAVGIGTTTSSRTDNFSNPPKPVINTARI